MNLVLECSRALQGRHGVLQPLHPGHPLGLGLAHAAFKGCVVAALLNGESYCCLENGIGL